MALATLPTSLRQGWCDGLQGLSTTYRRPTYKGTLRSSWAEKGSKLWTEAPPKPGPNLDRKGARIVDRKGAQIEQTVRQTNADVWTEKGGPKFPEFRSTPLGGPNGSRGVHQNFGPPNSVQFRAPFRSTPFLKLSELFGQFGGQFGGGNLGVNLG